MKNFFLFLFTTVALTINLNAQDVITKRNGDDIEAKVLEVLDSEIKYKKFNFLDGPTYTEKKSEILIIRYENGSKDIFTENDTETAKRKVSKENNNLPNRSIAVRGGLSVPNIYNPTPIDIINNGTITKNSNYAISLNTLSSNKKFSLSISVAPFDFVQNEYYNNYFENLYGEYTTQSKGVAILSEFYWHYIQEPMYSMYSGLGAGIMRFKITETDNNNIYPERIITNDILQESIHLTFFGVEYYVTPNMGLYAEFGFGRKGILTGGLQFQF